MSQEENIPTPERIPFFQRMLDNPFLLLFIGVDLVECPCWKTGDSLDRYRTYLVSDHVLHDALLAHLW